MPGARKTRENGSGQLTPAVNRSEFEMISSGTCLDVATKAYFWWNSWSYSKGTPRRQRGLGR